MAASPNCKDVITACDDALAKKDKALKLSDLAIKDCQSQVGTLQTELNDRDAKLAAWYHNPIVLIALGIIVGGAGTLMLKSNLGK